MLTKGVWNHINMLSILMIMMMMFAWTPSSAEPGPAPQNYWLSSLFESGTTELPPTGDNLLKAAEEGNLDVIKDLLARGAAINYGDGEPLAQAGRNGHLEVVKYLLESGANPNGTNEERSIFSGKPLQDAARNNHLDIIDLLLEFGAAVKLPRYGVKVMDRASENGHLEAIQRLLKAGADPDDGDGYTVLLAAKEGHLDVVKAFIEAGADVNNGDGWIVANAAEEGHLEVVRALVEAGATKETISYSMVYAASKGHLEVIKLLLEKGADPSYGSVLKSAAVFGDVEVVRTLLEAGSNITYNETVNSPLHFAAVEGHPEVIAVLVEYGDDINRALQKDIWWDVFTPYDANYGNGWTVMHVAARFGHPMVQELLELGADINIPDVKGRTPLHVAVFNEKFLVAKELLRFCADLTDVDNEGQTVLDVAKDVSLKNASDTSEYRILMSMLKEILPEKIALTPSSDKAIKALRDEFLALLKANSTMKERLKDVETDYLDVYSSLSYIFEERARTDIVNIIEDHNCKAPMEEKGITVAIGTEYLARCECVSGQGPKMTLTPREEANLCSPVSPPQEEE